MRKMAWITSDKGTVPGTYHNWNTDPVVEGIFKGSDGRVITIEGASRTYRPIRSTESIRKQLKDLKVKEDDQVKIEKGTTVGKRRPFKVSKWVEDGTSVPKPSIVPIKKTA
jgi:hypothetical protein